MEIWAVVQSPSVVSGSIPQIHCSSIDSGRGGGDFSGNNRRGKLIFECFDRDFLMFLQLQNASRSRSHLEFSNLGIDVGSLIFEFISIKSLCSLKKTSKLVERCIRRALNQSRRIIAVGKDHLGVYFRVCPRVIALCSPPDPDLLRISQFQGFAQHNTTQHSTQYHSTTHNTINTAQHSTAQHSTHHTAHRSAPHSVPQHRTA
jgi:hypothetical protein